MRDSKRMRIAKLLASVSCVSLVGGLYFPVAVLVDHAPSAMAYGILLVSFPAWTLGLLSGAGASYVASRAEGMATRVRRFSWVCAGMNLMAIIISWLWAPAGTS